MHGSIRHPAADNPLRTRAELQEAVRQLIAPLRPHYSEGGARLRLGATGASYAPEVSQLEGFSRVLWGVAPLLAGQRGSELAADDRDWAERCVRGFRSGTDPAHPDYWGDFADYDQKMVETAAFGFALALAPEQLWEPLSEADKERVAAWLSSLSGHPVWDCNWLFFPVIVNLALRKLGLPWDEALVERNLDRIDAFYLGEGWYADGVGAHADYYVPFAFHYYGLFYSVLMGQEDPERSAKYRERAAAFALDFVHWFDADGAALPYGRSLSYRFSQAAFWGALAYAGVEALPWGVMKGLLLRHLRWWLRQPIFGPDGVLTIGYAYPNLVMAENYNAPGSPYWALKSFLPLALPQDHPFWSAEELALPALEAIRPQRPARLVLSRAAGGRHVAAFNAGHPGTNEHTHASAKYEKFVYSTVFGFSVPRAEWGLAQGAFDSMLALSERDNLYRVRRRNEESQVDGEFLYARWQPWHDVEIRTWLVAGLPWHMRIHRIESARPLDAAEGGFALRRDLADPQAEQGPGLAAASGAGGAVAIEALLAGGERSGELLQAQANTNVLHPRTFIPMLRSSHEPGIFWLASAVFGAPGEAVGADAGAGDGSSAAPKTAGAAGAELAGAGTAGAEAPAAEAAVAASGLRGGWRSLFAFEERQGSLRVQSLRSGRTLTIDLDTGGWSLA
ncbi:DUF2264 domain-containing protein [Paenibacillus sp. FSL W8-1187]|uniref:DUF2264 domain-containing protein n=1 Tax=Paenibacillus sp. FSL W8-1187 TaxID=2975339 RepID=UPI0030DA7DC9